MAKVKLKPAAKILIVIIVLAAGFALYNFVLKDMLAKGGGGGDGGGDEVANGDGDTGNTGNTGKKDVYRVALSEWPGHMPMVIGNGGLKTQAGSAADREGIKLEIVFIEDPIKKNAALQNGSVDFVWQVVDEMPINMGGYKQSGVEPRAFLQLDWSRGGDACVASKEIETVEDILGHKSAMMMFSPDHTVFEFMINNSRLTPDQIAQVRQDTSFSMDDFTYGRVLFVQNKVDVACLWEPDVTLALEGRPGAHRLFSTADATELIADVLLTRQDTLASNQDVAEKVAKVWFAGVEQAESDRQAAARLIAQVVPRFRDELGVDGTLGAFEWVKWTNLSDNARFFGVSGGQVAFDRVYNQADGVWTQYPKAEITDRFAPSALRNDKIVAELWENRPDDEPVAATTRPEPEYKPEVADTGRAVFTKPVTINFDTGQSALDPESMHLLNTQVLPQLEMAGGMYVRIEGNTDNVGDKRGNQALSEARAQSVLDYLVQKGINAKRLSARGNGSDSPVASNKTADGRAANRRTDIVFISGQE
ncbi:phosphate ABC transporter substrate-binding/OmpA family protein [Haliangium ochraceum]|uniref:OmpA/MotB domain protein n=1 Tax=Haliangium ochraceum (strain DSM 14365 / JCM 11303 / SMP-2) TaxID=502025 RepID=D0LVL3_HALO1|nr:phosphate ABC transporter substrate-binding/OmpA family protein [Haliangium ochraceum]ACY17574.1 OmpA/MotB domain protein [Haliangium ochraceum DSM 14365]